MKDLRDLTDCTIEWTLHCLSHRRTEKFCTQFQIVELGRDEGVERERERERERESDGERARERESERGKERCLHDRIALEFPDVLCPK